MDLFVILCPYWVLIYISGSLFSLFWFHPRILSHICSDWFRVTLLANFDFYLCLRINFHTSSFRSLLGPYFTKNGSLLGPYLKDWGSLLVLETVGWCYQKVFIICSSVLVILHLRKSGAGSVEGKIATYKKSPCLGKEYTRNAWVTIKRASWIKQPRDWIVNPVERLIIWNMERLWKLCFHVS